MIVFCFVRATVLFLSRLMEVCGGREDLSNLYVVAIPFPDLIPRAGCADEIAQHREKTGKTLPRDHFSQQRHVDVYRYGCLQRVTHTAEASRWFGFSCLHVTGCSADSFGFAKADTTLGLDLGRYSGQDEISFFK